MALALPSVVACSFNPFHAAITRVAEVSIVGLDQRAIKDAVARLSPQHMAKTAVRRLAERVVMDASSEVDAPPKVVGDYGFDPLQLGKDLPYMREAEIKHGRLAMMAAVAWPLQEILHPILVDGLNAVGMQVPNLLAESNGASPSLVNGGLFQPELLPSLLLFTLGCVALEVKDVAARKTLGCEWNEYPESIGPFGRQPGNFGFDPLNLYRPLSFTEKVSSQERELANGRVAMLAVASYVATEFVAGEPVVRATPALFQPLIFTPWFRSFMDASFSVASDAPAAL